jgi:hypothetical protein
MTTPKLPLGNYMKVSRVEDFLSKRPNLVLNVKQTCPIHEGEFDIYYSTEDLKKVIEKDLFQLMECDVITHMIVEEFSLLSNKK